MPHPHDFGALSKVLASILFTVHVVVPTWLTVLVSTQPRPTFPRPLRNVLLIGAAFILVSGVVEVAWWLPEDTASISTRTAIVEVASIVSIAVLLGFALSILHLESSRVELFTPKPDPALWAEELFNQSPIGLALVSISGHWLKVNREVEVITGYTAAQLTGGMTFQDITYPPDLPTDLSGVASLLRGEQARYSMLKRYIRSDQSTTWVRLSVSLKHDEVGEPAYFIAQIEPYASHMAAQVALEKRLGESQARVASLERQNEVLHLNLNALLQGRVEHALVEMKALTHRKSSR